MCTGVMMHGYGLVKKLCLELQDFMKKHNFTSIEDFRGYGIELICSFPFSNFFYNNHRTKACLTLCPSFFFYYENLRVSLEYFTTHTDLVRRQKEAVQKRKAIKKGLQSDKDWTGDGFVQETESMVSNWNKMCS